MAPTAHIRNVRKVSMWWIDEDSVKQEALIPPGSELDFVPKSVFNA